MKSSREKISNVAVELVMNGENLEYGATVWFGTRSKRSAITKVKKLASLVSDKNFKKFPKEIV